MRFGRAGKMFNEAISGLSTKEKPQTVYEKIFYLA
jgi:hypothetical protein